MTGVILQIKTDRKFLTLKKVQKKPTKYYFKEHLLTEAKAEKREIHFKKTNNKKVFKTMDK